MQVSLILQYTWNETFRLLKLQSTLDKYKTEYCIIKRDYKFNYSAVQKDILIEYLIFKIFKIIFLDSFPCLKKLEKGNI